MGSVLSENDDDDDDDDDWIISINDVKLESREIFVYSTKQNFPSDSAKNTISKEKWFGNIKQVKAINN